jgi:hypothetical protein
VSILVDRRDGVLAVPARRGARAARRRAGGRGVRHRPQGVRQQLRRQRGGGAGRDAAASNTVA